MKIATSFLAALLFTGTLGSVNTAMSADGVISKSSSLQIVTVTRSFTR